MVGFIQFDFPTADVDDAKNPLADAAFMAQIGAKKLISEANDTNSEYELRNAATGTRFTFYWRWDRYPIWRLKKKNN